MVSAPGIPCLHLMLWTAPPQARERHRNEAVRAPTIRRGQICKRSRQSVSISRSQSFRFTALMLVGRWSKAQPTLRLLRALLRETAQEADNTAPRLDVSTPGNSILVPGNNF